MVFYLPLDECAGTIISDQAPYTKYRQQILTNENISLGIIDFSVDEGENPSIKLPFWSWENTEISTLSVPGFTKVNGNNPTYNEDMILKIEDEIELSLGEIKVIDTITISFWIKVVPFLHTHIYRLTLLEGKRFAAIKMNATIEDGAKFLNIEFMRYQSTPLTISSVTMQYEPGWQFYSASGNKYDSIRHIGAWSLLSNKYGTNYAYKRTLFELGNDKMMEWKLIGHEYTYMTHIKIWNECLTPGEVLYQKDYILNPREYKSLVGYWKLDQNTGNSLYNLIPKGNPYVENLDIEIPEGTAYWDSTHKKHELLEIGEIKYNNLIEKIEDYTYVLEAESNYNISIVGLFEHLWISFFYKAHDSSTELKIEFPWKFELNVDENTIVLTKYIDDNLPPQIILNIDYSIGFSSWTHFLIGMDYSDRVNVAIKCQIIQCSTSLIKTIEEGSAANEYYSPPNYKTIPISVKFFAASLNHFTIWNKTISDMPIYYRYL